MSQKSQRKDRDLSQGANLSPSTDRIEQRVSTQPRQLPTTQQLQTKIKPKKTKSRGNRKLQRFRAKLRKRGLNEETIVTLINDYNHSSQGQDLQQSSRSDMDVEALIPAQDQVSRVDLR
jgi:hypothetical protein